MPPRPATLNPRPANGHGGRRPGAGAPRGNLNGLKHGLRSRQLRRLARRSARDPDMQSIVAALHRHGLARQRAALAVAIWLRHVGRLAGDPAAPAPPPLTQRQLKLLARALATRAIKKMETNGTWRGD